MNLELKQEFNKPLYEWLLYYMTEANDMKSLTYQVINRACNEIGTHIENEEVTLSQLYINAARSLVLTDLTFTKENREKLESIRKAIGLDDVVKAQKFNDLAFAVFYEDCVVNALTKFNMTSELYNELNDIQRNYGISKYKATEIESSTASMILTSVIDEFKQDGVTVESLIFLKKFYESVTFQFSDESIKAYDDFMESNTHLYF